MPRMRTVKPEFFTSEQIVECSPIARLLFIGLWCFCDDGGCHPASAARLKMEVFPADDLSVDDVVGLVSELISARLLESYVVDGKEFWHVTGWRHQKIERPTYLYPRSAEFGEHSSNSRRGLGDPSPPESSRVESSRVERSRVESKKEDCTVAAPQPTLPAAARIDQHVFPVFGCAAGKRNGAVTWLLSSEQIAEWQETFPAVDVLAEARKAHAWVKANWSRRKTVDGMPEFIRRWLAREQDRAGANSSGNGGSTSRSRKDYTP